METNTKILITSAVVGTGAVIGYLLLTSRGAQAQPPTTGVTPVAPTTECAYLDESVKGSTAYTREPQNWPVVENYRGVQIYNRAGGYHIFTTEGISEAANITDMRKMIDDACAKTMGCPSCQYGADETVPYGWSGRTIGNYTNVYGATDDWQVL
jgi:hypothetical protein